MERNGGMEPPLQGRWRHDSRRGCSINFGGRDAGDVAGEEAGGGVREAAEELPDGEIGDEEELDGAEERGEANARDGAAIAKPEADCDVDEEAGVNDEHQFVETNE